MGSEDLFGSLFGGLCISGIAGPSVIPDGALWVPLVAPSQWPYSLALTIWLPGPLKIPTLHTI
eukprot:757188-Lingulodinium_polyedra.AAC.1